MTEKRGGGGCSLPWCISFPGALRLILCSITRRHHCHCSWWRSQIPACSLLGMSCLYFLNDAPDNLIAHPEVKNWALTEIDQTHPGSQRAPDSKALCSAWRPVCLRCNYPDCSSAMVDTSTHGGFTMENTNKDAHLCPAIDSKPSSLLVMSVMISRTRSTSRTCLKQVPTCEL